MCLVGSPTRTVLFGGKFSFMIRVERMGPAQDFVKLTPTVAETTK